MKQEAQFYFDVGSPASYLAWTQLPALCDSTGARLVLKPMLLGGVFQATGNASPATIAAKGRYLNVDLARFARRYGVPFAINPHFPINTLLLMRAITATALREPARLRALVDTVFRAVWVESLDLNDASVTAASLARAGFDPQALLAATSDPAVKAALKTATEDAVARGVFGAPTVFVGEAMFFGQDRLDFVREHWRVPEFATGRRPQRPPWRARATSSAVTGPARWPQALRR